MPNETSAGQHLLERQRQYLRFFGRDFESFPSDRKSDATVLANEQNNAWRTLFSRIGNETDLSGRIGSEVRQRFHAIARSFVDHIAQSPPFGSVQKSPEGPWICRSNWPIISMEKFEDVKDIFEMDPFFALAAPIYVLSSKIDTDKILGDQDNRSFLGDARMIRAFVDAGAIAQTDPPFISNDAVIFDNIKMELKRKTTQADALLDRMSESFNKFDSRFNNFFAEKEGEIVSLKEQVRDSIKLDVNLALWENRAVNNLRAMRKGFIAFLLIICGATWFIFTKAVETISATTAANVTPTLVVVFASIVGIGWILRLIARFTLDNLSLRADAQHRHTMLQTYLALRGEGAIAEAERLVMLSALFRPLPGQGADDSAPPSPIIEALSKLQK